MKLLGWELSDWVLLLPALLAVAGILVLGGAMLEQVSVTYVYMGLYLVFGLGGLVLYHIGRFPERYERRLQFDFVFATPLGRRVLSTLFFLLFAAAVLALKFLSPGAVRPDSYYAIASVAVGVLFLRSLASSGEQRDVRWVLGQILLLGFLIRFALIYLNPYPYVSDAKFHWTLVQRTIEAGQFNGSLWFGAPYQFYPVYHLFDTATFLFATGTSEPAWLYPVVNSSIICLTLPAVFLVGRYLRDDLTGLLASLLVLTTNFYFLQPHYTTNWVAITFMLFSVLVLLELFDVDQRNHSMWFVFWLFATTSLLVHPVNFAVLVQFLIGAFLVSVLLQWTLGTSSGVPVFSATLLFLSYLFNVHQSVFVELTTTLFGTSESTAQESLTHTSNVVDIPVLSSLTTELTLNYIGVTALVLFAVPAGLYLLQRQELKRNAFVAGTGVTFVFSILVFVSGLGGELEIVRVINYISPYIAILAAVGVTLVVGSDRLSRLAPRRITTDHVVAVFFVFVVVVAALSMASYTSGNFNGTLSEDVNHYQLTVKPSTLATHSFMEQTPANATVTGDYITLMYIAAFDPIGGATEPVRSANTLEQYDNATEMQIYFGANWTESRYFIVNEPVIQLSNSFTGPNYEEIYLQANRSTSKVYATEGLSVYFDPKATD